MALMREKVLFCACLSYATCLQGPEHERLRETECQCEAGYSRQGACCAACPTATFKEYAGDNAENGPAYGGAACLPCSTGWYKTSTSAAECEP
jgi:hypothetical protein